jgi:hypothetical protein
LLGRLRDAVERVRWICRRHQPRREG